MRPNLGDAFPNREENLFFDCPLLGDLVFPHTAHNKRSDEGGHLGLAGWELSDGTRLQARRGAAVFRKRLERRRYMFKPAGSGERLGLDDLGVVLKHADRGAGALARGTRNPPQTRTAWFC